MSATRKFVAHIVPGVVNPLRVLWNEVLAFLFLAITLITLQPIYKSWREWNVSGDPGALARFIMAAIFGLFMLSFGIASMLRARRLGRRHAAAQRARISG